MDVEKPTDNDKFTFRLFLVRLGLIGNEYATTRRIMLRNLTGNGSWKDGQARKPVSLKETPTSPTEPDLGNGENPPTRARSQKRRFSFSSLLNNLKMMGY